jgi:ribA/ribD-fused uncharacterized protein
MSKSKADRLADDEVDDPILFWGNELPWGVFSNFSDHPIVLPQPFTQEWALYPTTEHRYQAMKAKNHDEHEFVRLQPGPGNSKQAGQQVKLRDGWGNDVGDLCYLVMFECLVAKYSLHPDVQTILRGSGERHIYEDSPYDNIWGWRKGNNYDGHNLLGKCWMQVRSLIT